MQHARPVAIDGATWIMRTPRSMERAARRTGLLSDSNSPAAAAWRVQRRQYFTLLQQKRSDFWTTRLVTEQSQPRRLWRSFDELLGRGRAPVSSDVDATNQPIRSGQQVWVSGGCIPIS